MATALRVVTENGRNYLEIPKPVIGVGPRGGNITGYLPDGTPEYGGSVRVPLEGTSHEDIQRALREAYRNARGVFGSTYTPTQLAVWWREVTQQAGKLSRPTPPQRPPRTSPPPPRRVEPPPPPPRRVEPPPPPAKPNTGTVESVAESGKKTWTLGRSTPEQKSHWPLTEPLFAEVEKLTTDEDQQRYMALCQAEAMICGPYPYTDERELAVLHARWGAKLRKAWNAEVNRINAILPADFGQEVVRALRLQGNAAALTRLALAVNSLDNTPTIFLPCLSVAFRGFFLGSAEAAFLAFPPYNESPVGRGATVCHEVVHLLQARFREIRLTSEKATRNWYQMTYKMGQYTEWFSCAASGLENDDAEKVDALSVAAMAGVISLLRSVLDEMEGRTISEPAVMCPVPSLFELPKEDRKHMMYLSDFMVRGMNIKTKDRLYGLIGLIANDAGFRAYGAPLVTEVDLDMKRLLGVKEAS